MTRSFGFSFIHSFVFVRYFARSFIHLFVLSCARSLFRSFVLFLIHPFIHSKLCFLFVCHLVLFIINSFVRLFVRFAAYIKSYYIYVHVCLLCIR